MTMLSVSTEFEARLKAILEQKSMLKHPFYAEWTQGKLPMEKLQEYARQYYHFEASFPRFLSAIHTRTESPSVRQSLLDNLWDEEHGDRNHPRSGSSSPRATRRRPRPKSAHRSPTRRRPPWSNTSATSRRTPPSPRRWGRCSPTKARSRRSPGRRSRASRSTTASSRASSSSSPSTSWPTSPIPARRWRRSRRFPQTMRPCCRAVEASCDRLLGFLDGCYAAAAA